MSPGPSPSSMIVRTLGEERRRSPVPGDMLFARSTPSRGTAVDVQVLCIIAVGLDDDIGRETIDCICVIDGRPPEVFRLDRRTSDDRLRAYGNIFWPGIWSSDSIMIIPREGKA